MRSLKTARNTMQRLFDKKPSFEKADDCDRGRFSPTDVLNLIIPQGLESDKPKGPAFGCVRNSGLLVWRTVW